METRRRRAGAAASVRIGGAEPISASDPQFAKKIASGLGTPGTPTRDDTEIVKIAIDPAAGLANAAKVFDIWSAQKLTIIAILTLLIMYAAMAYGPMAAALVELFPTRIRYSGLSLPYHIGNGWFGGLLPATSFAIVAATGDIYSGLWYPVVIAAATVCIGVLLVPETHKCVDEYTERTWMTPQLSARPPPWRGWSARSTACRPAADRGRSCAAPSRRSRWRR